MIYKSIVFDSEPFHYKLFFEDKITLVRGDSASGRTFLFKLLQDLSTLDEYKNIQTFNYQCKDFEQELINCKNSLIVIDNADVILTDNLKMFINLDKSNQYLIFGRNCSGLNCSLDSFTELSNNNCVVTSVKELNLWDIHIQKTGPP